MNVLIVGSGGREHALGWAIAKSPKCGKLYFAPGNAGTAGLGENIEATTNIEILRFAKKRRVDLVIVGPEKSLVAGIVDDARAHEIPIFGPSRAAAQIEWSKVFAKELMRDAWVSTAPFRVFTESDHCATYGFVHLKGVPIVIKADGPCEGKGVYPCKTFEDAHFAIHDLMRTGIYRNAGRTILIEKFLEGKEISLHALSDGKTELPLPTAEDHKRLYDGGKGPNTGGMGVIAPVPWVTPKLEYAYWRQVVLPILQELEGRGHPFTGCLYPGIMQTPDSGSMVLEVNARFGDPEAQALVRIIDGEENINDLLTVLDACARGKLITKQRPYTKSGFAVCVNLVARGYPKDPEFWKLITGVKEAEGVPGVVVFHAGTIEIDGKLYSAGGRVLSVTAVGATVREARKRAYEAVRMIHFSGCHYRSDIGLEAEEYEAKQARANCAGAPA